MIDLSRLPRQYALMIKLAMLGALRVKDVMSEALVLLRADTELDEAWGQLHERGVSGAPVLDASGRLVGVLSLSDLADPRRRRPPERVTVGEAMTLIVYAVRAEDPVNVAIRLMIDERIHRVVVVNDDGSLAGIVVPMDILRAAAQGHDVAVEYVDLRELQIRR